MRKKIRKALGGMYVSPEALSGIMNEGNDRYSLNSIAQEVVGNTENFFNKGIAGKTDIWNPKQLGRLNSSWLNGVPAPAVPKINMTQSLTDTGGVGSLKTGKKGLFSGVNMGDVASYANKGLDVISGFLPKLDNTNDVNTGLKIASEVAGLIPGPWGQGISAGLKAVNMLDQATAKKSNTQFAVGQNLLGYKEDINAKAGTSYGGLFGNGARRRTNALTDKYETSNILKGWASQGARQDNLMANNMMQDTASRNQQSLYGGINTNILAAKKGAKVNPAQLRNLTKKAKKKPQVTVEPPKFQEGGKLNVIPDGALHARKHDLPEEIAEQVTDNGIPVVTYDEGGNITQHAEIELNEIIFHKETTNTLEDYFKKYKEASDEEKNQLAIECGKFLASEILENTEDRTGLLNEVE